MHSRFALPFATAIHNHRTFHSVASSFYSVVLGRACSTMEALVETEPVKEEKVRDKKGTRYNGRIRKRLWEEGPTFVTKRSREGDEPFQRIKKRKMAILLGYNGMDYFGMQRNPNVNTIEEELCKALLSAGYIDDEAFANMKQIDFQRAARTDKGVSAARQVVSVKLPEEAVPEKINETLPPCIRVFGVKRATKGFNSKIQCDARTYSYTLPTFAFEPDATTPEQQKAYRIPQTKIDHINDVLSVYKGTKNFHNFTSKKDFHDPSCLRFITSFQIDKVFVNSDVEFAILKVKGQSFMLHQIRKMVGILLAVIRGIIPAASIEKAFENEKTRLPIAPGLGLLLEQVHYDRYDTRYGADGMHATLDWSELKEITEQFKMDFIMPNVVKTEIAENSMAQWVEELHARHSFDPKDATQEEKEDESTLCDNDDEETEDVTKKE